MVKCVALEDMILRLNYLGASNSLNASTEDLHICANGLRFASGDRTAGGHPAEAAKVSAGRRPGRCLRRGGLSAGNGLFERLCVQTGSGKNLQKLQKN